MAVNNIHNIATLLKRLEAAVSRLEDIATSTTSTTLHPEDTTLIKEVAEAFAPSSVSVPEYPKQLPEAVASGSPEDLPEVVKLFDKFLETAVDPFLETSREIGGLVSEQAAIIGRGFLAQRHILLIMSKAKKPHNDKAAQKAYHSLLQPIEHIISSLRRLQEENRGTPAFNMLSAVADGSFVLTWVTVESRPWKQVEESLSMAQFFGNKVLKEYPRGSLETLWVEAFYTLFKELVSFLRQAYPYGITWNGQGDPLQSLISK